MEVADRPAEERGDPAAARPYPVESPREVADDTAYPRLRVVAAQGPHRLLQIALVDVEEDAALELPRPGHGVEQQPDLSSRSRAQLDQLPRSDRGDDLLGDPLQDALLGPRLVILRQPGDFLEEPAPAVVVEVLAGEGRGVARERLPYFGRHVGSHQGLGRVD